MAYRVPIAKPTSGAAIDLKALDLLKQYQPSTLSKPSPFDVEAFFELDLEDLTGIKTDYRKLPHGIHGFTDSDKKLCVVSRELMDGQNKNCRYYARSTIAHEISHALIHVPQFREKKATLRSVHDNNHASLKMYRQDDIPLYKNPEWQAWRYAGAVLMPEAPFRELVMNGACIREMADVFQVNPAFVQTRAKALKIRLK